MSFWQKTKDVLWNDRSFLEKCGIALAVGVGITAATFATLGAFGIGIGVAGAASVAGGWIAGAASSVWAGVTSFGVGGALANSIVGGALLLSSALGITWAATKVNQWLSPQKEQEPKGPPAMNRQKGPNYGKTQQPTISQQQQLQVTQNHNGPATQVQTPVQQTTQLQQQQVGQSK